jgi:hypothetical protein
MQIDEQLTKCLVITNYRTGSRDFCIKNERKNRLKMNLFEIIHKGGKYLPIKPAVEQMRNTKKFIAKVMPDQFAYDFEKLEQLMGPSEQIVYLYRKDFRAQCLSWIASNYRNDYDRISSIQGADFLIDIDQTFADKHIQMIEKNNDFLKECIKRYPAPVYAYEDINDGNPYKRSYNWKYMPFIKDYNTEEIYNETII